MPLPNITIRSNARVFSHALSRRRKAERSAMMSALTGTAFDIARKDLPRNMKRYFRQPTRFTLNAFLYVRARPVAGGFKASVNYKYAGGRLRRHYLESQVHGGKRAPKAVEKLISARAGAGFPKRLYPTPAVPRDVHGNVTRGWWNRLLSDLKAHREMGSMANRTDRSVKRNKNYSSVRFFIVTKDKHLAPGVWARKGEQLYPVLLDADNVRYSRRLPLERIERRAVQLRYPVHLARARARFRV